MKKSLSDLREEIESSTSIVGDLKTPLSITDRTYRQKINKEMEELSNVLN